MRPHSSRQVGKSHDERRDGGQADEGQGTKQQVSEHRLALSNDPHLKVTRRKLVPGTVKNQELREEKMMR
jgi:hypothetical protein